jgi:hypothetical protein
LRQSNLVVSTEFNYAQKRNPSFIHISLLDEDMTEYAAAVWKVLRQQPSLKPEEFNVIPPTEEKLKLMSY